MKFLVACAAICETLPSYCRKIHRHPMTAQAPSPFVATAIVLACALAWQPRGRADVLTPAGTFAPVFTFTETHSERVVEMTDPDDASYKWAEVGAVDATNLCIKANITALDPASIDASTEFTLGLGDLDVQFSLGDDPSYTVGKNTAFFPTHGWDASNKPIGTEGLSLSWAAGVLTVKLVNSANSDEDAGPFFPAYSMQVIGENNSSIRKVGTLGLSFGGLTGDAQIFLDGTAKTTTQHYANSDYEDDLDITQAKLNGALDVTAPTVAVTGPASAQPNDEGLIAVTGTAIDGHGIASVEVSTTPDDPDSWQEATTDWVTPRPDEDEWTQETVRWSFDMEELGIGTTQLSVRAIDLAGNASTPSVFTVVRDVPVALTGRWDALVVPDEDGSAPSGSITFQCSTTGKISGRLTLRDPGRTYPFTGNWSGDTVRAVVARPGLTSLVLEAGAPYVDVEGPGDAWLDGSLTEVGADAADPAVGYFGAFRSPYSSTSPAPEEIVGRYNASASAPDETVLGASTLSLTARPAGSVLLIGRLADGTPFTWSGKLGAGGQVPVYASLYARKGLFSAMLGIDGYSIYADTGIWLRPAGAAGGQFPDGFTADSLTIEGEIYTAPSTPDRVMGLADSTQNASIDISGDGAEEGLSVLFTVDALNHSIFDAPNAEALRVTFNASTGAVSGSFKLPTTGSIAKFNGLIVGDQVIGSYIAPNGTAKSYGSVSIYGDQSGSDDEDWGDEVEEVSTWDWNGGPSVMSGTSSLVNCRK